MQELLADVEVALSSPAPTSDAMPAPPLFGHPMPGDEGIPAPTSDAITD